ncbi:hypothetical protein XENORESO_002790 [Xenotaenia resolanae]|uniref:Uncharacterized protein n=1 Tax=Xenotaenia resolanae TaxID=208358 RepID=A0ABV0VNQ1_9TELE
MEDKKKKKQEEKKKNEATQKKTTEQITKGGLNHLSRKWKPGAHTTLIRSVGMMQLLLRSLCGLLGHT